VRQTTLTAEELIIRLLRRDREHPRCFYVNELGELARQGDTTAEGALVSYLDPEESDDVRAAAYIHLLAVMRPLAKVTATALREFADRTANADIVQWAERQYGLGLPAA